MSGSWEAELRFAEHLADVSDAISMQHFRRADTLVRTKPDGTPVTEADEAIEQALRDEIASAYPDHGVLGEEAGAQNEGARSRWILDPIDGTKNFSWGIRIWGTLIAHEVDGEVVCGVVSVPAMNERFSAARGSGATRNSEPISVSSVSHTSDARLAFTSARAFESLPQAGGFRELLAKAADDRGIGDCYGHMLVAAGSLDLMIEPQLNYWDIGPLIVIVEEAGGRLTDFAGQRHIYGGSCVTSNGRLHDDALRILGAVGPKKPR